MYLKNKLLHVSILLSLLTCNLLAEQNGFIYSLAGVGMSMDYMETGGGKNLDSEKADLSELLGYEMNLGYRFNSNYAGSDLVTVNFLN